LDAAGESIRSDPQALSDPNPYRSPEHGDAARQVSSRAARARRYDRVVLAVLIVVLLCSAFQLLTGTVALMTARATYVDGLWFLSEWYYDFQDALSRDAMTRGIAKLVFGTALALFACLPWRYSRRLHQVSDGRDNVRAVELESGVLAFLGFTTSCLGVGGSMILSVAALSYYGAVILGYGLLFCCIAGFVISVISLAVGKSAGARGEGTWLLHALAWTGAILSAGMIAYVFVSFVVDVFRISLLLRS